MQIQSHRAYTPDSDLLIGLSQMVPRMIGSLDGFLSAIHEQHPELLDGVASKLLHAVSTWGDEPADASARIAERNLFEGCSFAERFHNLFIAHIQWLWQLSGVSPADWVSDEPIVLSQVRFIRMRYLPNYLRIKVLVDLMGREAAVCWMKQYLDAAILSAPSRVNAPQSLIELRDQQITFNLKEKGMDWVSAIISDHQYLNKVTTCRIQKVLAAYEDDALMEVVACYPDFSMFRMVNDGFRLTRTQTLMNGGDCCDSCYHDARYVRNFVHPSLDIFTSLEG